MPNTTQVTRKESLKIFLVLHQPGTELNITLVTESPLPLVKITQDSSHALRPDQHSCHGSSTIGWLDFKTPRMDTDPASDQCGHSCEGRGAMPAMAPAMQCNEGDSSCTTERVLHSESTEHEDRCPRAGPAMLHPWTFHPEGFSKFLLTRPWATSSDLTAGPAVNRGWTRALQRCFQWYFSLISRRTG